MVSYAQNAEDVVLRNAFAGRQTGFYVDIGANHPVHDSVTKHFYDLGWCGINIEPVQELHAELCRQRPRDINLCLGVGATTGDLEFAQVEPHLGLSTFSPRFNQQNIASGRKFVQRIVPIKRLADILEEHAPQEIDFLKVDVEGFEADVFAGNDWSRFRPKVILAEANFEDAWHPFVESQGYTQTLHDGLNRFYVRNDLLHDVGRRLHRPAVIALDGYDPWFYILTIQQLHAQQEEAQRHAQRLEARLAATPGRRLLGKWRKLIASLGGRRSA
jgi:FkbM family methyltransferase